MKTSRRKFMQDAIKVSVATSLSAPLLFSSTKAKADGKEILTPAVSALQFSQIALPYAFNALEPNIDAMTMEIHYSKHHTAYIKNVNDAITAENLSFTSEQDFFNHASKLSAKAKNNGGGAWNHNFFWQVMKPNGGGVPSGKIGEAITGAFGSFDKFKEEFAKAATGRFGSGWAWLVNDGGKLKIGSTANQDNPLMDNSELKGTPLLGIDVWEHAYYLKYQNKRADYVTSWWNVVNWDEVAKRLA
ncbi:MAG TPA: superoxide dismutase [Cyclobacteriaceae bacterium]|nr:superoxide dismutase [Cyclobacteriaceae bacterium]